MSALRRETHSLTPRCSQPMHRCSKLGTVRSTGRPPPRSLLRELNLFELRCALRSALSADLSESGLMLGGEMGLSAPLDDGSFNDLSVASAGSGASAVVDISEESVNVNQEPDRARGHTGTHERETRPAGSGGTPEQHETQSSGGCGTPRA